jgi:hypothetical protein
LKLLVPPILFALTLLPFSSVRAERCQKWFRFLPTWAAPSSRRTRQDSAPTERQAKETVAALARSLENAVPPSTPEGATNFLDSVPDASRVLNSPTKRRRFEWFKACVKVSAPYLAAIALDNTLSPVIASFSRYAGEKAKDVTAENLRTAEGRARILDAIGTAISALPTDSRWWHSLFNTSIYSTALVGLSCRNLDLDHPEQRFSLRLMDAMALSFAASLTAEWLRVGLPTDRKKFEAQAKLVLFDVSWNLLYFGRYSGLSYLLQKGNLLDQPGISRALWRKSSAASIYYANELLGSIMYFWVYHWLGLDEETPPVPSVHPEGG